MNPRGADVKRSIAFMVIVLGLSGPGCSSPTIDASSDEAMRASARDVRESLPEGRRAEFDEAIQILAFSQLDMSDLLSGGRLGEATIEARVKAALDGKNAEEIFARAEEIKAERLARERRQALAEIQELEEKRLEAEMARDHIAEFEVIRSRFFLREERYSGAQPIIELSVRNGTNSPISRAYFKGVIASPNRSIPWHSDGFNYEISGGLEPGEEASWSLAPNRFSDWGKVNAPTDAVFTVTVERLDGPNGQVLYSAAGFDERDATRLSELKRLYGVE